MAGLSLALVGAVAATGWLFLRDGEYVAPPPEAPSASIRSGAAAGLLHDLLDAVRTGDEAAAEGLAPVDDPAAQRRLATLVRNLELIGIDDLSLRYVDELGGLDDAGRWRAAADLTWSFAGFDPQTSAAEIEVRFATADDGTVSITGLGGGHGLRPVWLADRVGVRRTDQTLVVSAAGEVATYDRLARRAVEVVQRVVPGWRSGLVVEVPRDAEAVDAALDAEPGAYANIAGVTAGPAGTLTAGSPVHVFLNPERLGRLQVRGAQVVVSHEAAHVALGAASSASLPVWLSEGFADYIALRDVPLPLSTTASQIIRQVRREGPPPALPDAADFDEESEYFGAAYEASWLACRLLVDRAGEETMLRFYRRAGEALDFDGLFRSTFGITRREFTREWQRTLSDLAA